ncbi:MAG: LptF/LptG family permease [Muribaculaceae bacterium]|nr:LptF/LptG family permease [Muribaculaceae bacterium]
MFRIKRLYLFMLQSYIPLFLMTFFICLFIVLMQFLWRYIDDLVGKGLEMSVIVELFWYAALTMVPMALPLAILLASLMTFGNLGERFELMAMKASGISLLKTMRPLIALMILVATGAFFFQNNVLPVAQSKMYTLLLSMKQKSPELEITEGVFNDQIPGRNIYIDSKNRETGMLYGVMIYDMSAGADIDQMRIILADSGRISVTEDKRYLVVRLYNGEQFENLRGQGNGRGNVPYRRESFSMKELLMLFDNNFNRMDESNMRNQYVGKNITELNHTIDSVSARVDSVGRVHGRELMEYPFFNQPKYRVVYRNSKPDTVFRHEVQMAEVLNLDTLFANTEPGRTRNIYSQALSKARRMKQEFEYSALLAADDNKTIRRHAIELQKKFTLSIACIIFFFIGAPLGAIIRKGGLGAPLVISVLLFIVYYIIDNTGYKLARDGHWAVWQGMWLSTAVLLPLGVFLTYKAINDSAVFNIDAWRIFLQHRLGLQQIRHVEYKEVAMEDVSPAVAREMLQILIRQTEEYIRACGNPRQSYSDFFLHGFDRLSLGTLQEGVDGVTDYLSNHRNKLLVNKLSAYPILRNLWLYNTTPLRWTGIIAMALFPVGLPLWLIGRRWRAELIKELKTVVRVSGELQEMI